MAFCVKVKQRTHVKLLGYSVIASLAACLAVSSLGKVSTFDMAVEAVLDHILSSMGQDFSNHIPFSTVFFINFDDRLVFIFGEPGSGLMVGLVAFLDTLRGNKLRVEDFGNLLPVFTKFFNIFLKQSVILWGPELHQLGFVALSLLLQVIAGILHVSVALREHVSFNGLVLRELFFKCGKPITKFYSNSFKFLFGSYQLLILKFNSGLQNWSAAVLQLFVFIEFLLQPLQRR